MTIGLLCAADGAAWEAAWLADLQRQDLGVLITRRCVDVVDLLAVAAAGQARAALVSHHLRRLDVDAVDRLIAADVRPIGVVPRDDLPAHDRLRAMGVTHLVPADAAASVVAAVVLDALATGADAEPPRGFADPMAAATTSVIADAVDPSQIDDAVAGDREGTVLAIWGPTGAPGRTTVAVTLADEIARLGPSTLLIDADVYGGVVGAMLGIMDESPGLVAACRAAGNSRIDAEGLGALCWQMRPGFRVLTGITLAHRWPELRASAVPAVLGAARALADYVLVDCGFSLETDEEISFDSMAPRRNGATLAVLDDADRLFAVGAADPIGVQRLVRGLSDLQDAGVTAQPEILLNRVGAAFGRPRAEADPFHAVERFAGMRPIASFPLDVDSLREAVVCGRTVGEICPKSPFRAAVSAFARELTGIEGRRRGRTRRGGS